MNALPHLAAMDSSRSGAPRRSYRLWIALLLIAVFTHLGICMSEHGHGAAPLGTALLDSPDHGTPPGGTPVAEGCSICSAVAACAMLTPADAVSEVALTTTALTLPPEEARTASRASALPDSRGPPLA